MTDDQCFQYLSYHATVLGKDVMRGKITRERVSLP